MSEPPQYLTNFMDNHIEDLIKIYIQERTTKGLGILVLKGNIDKTNVNVFYVEREFCKDEYKNLLTTQDSSTKAHFVLVEESNIENEYMMIHELDPKKHEEHIQQQNEKQGVPELID